MEFTKKDIQEMEHMRFALGQGASLRYANELRAVQQPGRLAPLKRSNLFEDVLRGNLGPASNVFPRDEDENGSYANTNLLGLKPSHHV